MVPSPTRLGRQPLSTVTGAKRHQNKYRVNNPKVSSLSLSGPSNWWWRRQRRRQRTMNRQCVRGIRDPGTTTEAAVSQWQALLKGDYDGGVGRGRLAQGLDNYNGGVNWRSSKYNAYELTSTAAEAPVCLHDKGIYNDNGSVGRFIWARRLSNNGETHR